MTGGRMIFEKEQRVRILMVDGKVSPEEYIVEIEKADRKGFITLSDAVTGRRIKTNQRRVLTSVNDGDAFVIATNDKYRAVCPHCSFVQEITARNDVMTCPDHGETKLHWKQGERSMTDTTTDTTVETAIKTSETAEKVKEKSQKPASTKVEKSAKEPIVVDFDKLTQNSAFELWTKSSQFDHEKIDVKSHALLITGNNPRKLCFNTYNGTLGKKGKPLPIDSFINDTEIDGKKTWYAVKDVEKAKEKLKKDGYVPQD